MGSELNKHLRRNLMDITWSSSQVSNEYKSGDHASLCESSNPIPYLFSLWSEDITG